MTNRPTSISLFLLAALYFCTSPLSAAQTTSDYLITGRVYDESGRGVSEVRVFGYLTSPISVAGQNPEITPKMVTLQARRKVNGYDNYTRAAFSFKHGVNGDESLSLTRNNWDILFGNSPDEDTFDVTMVTDDCSRIKDLGELSWYDNFEIPVLIPHPEPAREPSVKAILGHMYVVHSKDRDNDHYALFRVEHLEPKQTVTISWKLIPAPPANLQEGIQR